MAYPLDYLISIGAIVYKDKSYTHVLGLYREETDTYHLPKGVKFEGETDIGTLHREVKEETNCDIQVERFHDTRFSTFERKGETIQKETRYHIAIHTGGSPRPMDGEHSSAFFMPVDEFRNKLKERGGHVLGYEIEYDLF